MSSSVPPVQPPDENRSAPVGDGFASPAEPRVDSTLALLSLVPGILCGMILYMELTTKYGFGLGFSLVGVVFGFVALLSGSLAIWRIRKRPRLRGTGLAMFPVVLGAITMGLAIVSYPSAVSGVSPRILRYQISTRSNLKSLGSALAMYSARNNEQLPPCDEWDTVLAGAGYANGDMLEHPKGPAGQRGFAMNAAVAGHSQTDLPADMVLIFECVPGSEPAGGKELLPKKPRTRGYVVLYAGLNVGAVRPEDVDKLRWDVEDDSGGSKGE